MTVPRDVVDAWTWADGWRLVRPLSEESIRALFSQIPGDFNEGDLLLYRILFVISPDGTPILPLYVSPDPERSSGREFTAEMNRFHHFSEKSRIPIGLEQRFAEGMDRILQSLSALHEAISEEDSIPFLRTLFWSPTLVDQVGPKVEAARRGRLENHGHPSEAGEVAMLLGVLPPEFTASMEDLRGAE